MYDEALKALENAHAACLRASQKSGDALGMSHGSFSGVNVALGIVFRLEAENDRLRDLVRDACKVFDHYDLPEHAFAYRCALGQSPREALNFHKGGE